MSDDKRTLYIGLAAAGILLAGAAMWYNSAPGESELVKKLKDNNLFNVERSRKNKIDREYFLRLLQFVGVETRTRTEQLRKSCLESRRVQYNVANWEVYKTIIKKQIDGEDEASKAVVAEVLPVLNISEEEFKKQHD